MDWEVFMFTGIIEELGRVRSIEHRGQNARIVIEAHTVTDDTKQGDSIAVNGVCLTALDIKPGSFCADLAPDTWERTSLSRIHEGALVNLELPMKADGRFGGHIVQGHVDATGELTALDELADGNWWLKLRVPADLDRYLVHKGSIAIDGISLTIATLGNAIVGVTIIPHTYANTTLGFAKPGSRLNVEVDVLAKHVEKLLTGSAGPRPSHP